MTAYTIAAIFLAAAFLAMYLIVSADRDHWRKVADDRAADLALARRGLLPVGGDHPTHDALVIEKWAELDEFDGGAR